MIPDRLKKIIFRKLYNDLSHVEIIPFNNSIWFVDRDEKYWYFELQKDGTLWWRYQFFSEFFILFSLVRDEFQSILAEWVEEVLNSRVYITKVWRGIDSNGMEVVLNSRVDTTFTGDAFFGHQVEEVLNSRVIKTAMTKGVSDGEVEEVLNSRVDKTDFYEHQPTRKVEEVLNSRVIKTYKLDVDSFTRVEEVLNSRVNTTPCVSGELQEKVDEVLNSRVLRTQVALYSTSVMAEDVLNSKGGELFDETIVDTVLSSLRSV